MRASLSEKAQCHTERQVTPCSPFHFSSIAPRKEYRRRLINTKRYRHQNTDRSRRRPVSLKPRKVEAATTIARVRSNRACDSLRRRNGTPTLHTRIQRERLPLASKPIATIRKPTVRKDKSHHATHGIPPLSLRGKKTSYFFVNSVG